MRIVDIPIEMIAEFSKEGKIRPVRLRVQNEDDMITMDIKGYKEPEIDRKTKVLRYVCRVVDNEVIKNAEIIFDMQECTWVLHKID